MVKPVQMHSHIRFIRPSNRVIFRPPPACPMEPITFPIAGVNGFTTTPNIGNLNLKPIITKELELGVEAKFFDNRIGLDATVYDKETDGQIFNVPISPSSGYSGLIENVGVVQNKGIEITFNATPVRNRDFTWNLNYTFSKNESDVVSLTNGLDKIQIGSDGLTGGMEFDLFPGKPVGIFYSPAPVYSPDGKIVVDPNTGFPVVNPDKTRYRHIPKRFCHGPGEFIYI